MLAPPPQRTPAAVPWYRAFCVLMAAGHGLLAFGGIALARNLIDFREYDPMLDSSFDPAILMRLGWTLAASAALFGLGNLALLLLPRRPWAYGIHLGNLVGAVLLCCPALFAGPLLWFWLKPDVKAWFDAD